MATFLCSCDKKKIEFLKYTVRVIDGKARPDLDCEKCGEPLKMISEKKGFPSFKSNSTGQVL
jgi:hypothetical protein